MLTFCRKRRKREFGRTKANCDDVKDWENFKRAADYHICNKSLIKDGFLDSSPVWNVEKAGEEGR